MDAGNAADPALYVPESCVTECRSDRQAGQLVTLLDELQHLSLGLVSLREALDLTSPIGRAMYTLVGVLAEVERAWIVGTCTQLFLPLRAVALVKRAT